VLAPAGLSAATSEYDIKAAFIYNIAKYVDWIERSGMDQQKSLPLCILGEDPFGNAIDKLQGRKVRGFTLHVKRIESIDDHSGCSILFISKSEKDDLPVLLDILSRGKGLLTISDIAGFAERGGMVELALIGNRVGLVVNIQVARSLDIYLSSKILRLAHVVGGAWGDNK